MNKNDYYMKLAFDIAQASKCVRAKYGSVLVSQDGRIVATAYNGKPRNSVNDLQCYRIGLEDNAPKPNCCLHAETNLIIFSSPEERLGSTVYVSGIPCTDCILLLAQSKIAKLVYYNGTAQTGHKGNFDINFYKKYGMTFEIVSVD